MDGKERFFNVLQGHEIDRRPFGAIMSLYGAGLTGCPLKKYYTDAAEYARGQQAVREAVDPDFLVTPFVLSGYGEAFGGVLRYLDNDVPNLLRPAIASTDDLPRLTMPDIETHPRLLYIRESLRRLVASHGRDKVIVAIVLNPLDLPIVLMGFEAWLKTVLTDEEGTRKMLDITAPFFVEFCNALFRDGADAVAMPTSFLTHAVATRRIVTDIALPVLGAAFAQVEGPLVLHHTGSSFLNYLDLMADLPNILGFTLNHRDDFGKAREATRQEHIHFAGLDGTSLHALSPSWIKARCLAVLEEQRQDARFVPFATGTDVMIHTPLTNLLAMREAIEEFGRG
jgi:uroporphyrinogen decarboxylase